MSDVTTTTMYRKPAEVKIYRPTLENFQSLCWEIGARGIRLDSSGSKIYVIYEMGNARQDLKVELPTSEDNGNYIVYDDEMRYIVLKPYELKLKYDSAPTNTLAELRAKLSLERAPANNMSDVRSKNDAYLRGIARAAHMVEEAINASDPLDLD